MFSISAVCATNETASDVNQNQDILLLSEEINDSGNNSDETPQTNNVSDNSTNSLPEANYSHGYTNVSVGAVTLDELPVLTLSVNYDEDSLAQNYVDVSIEYNNNSFSIDNKNYFFTVSQNDNSIKNADDHKLVSIFTSAKNNNMLLNVNFLNVSNQTVNLANSNNLLGMLWNMIISIFNSLFK